MTKPARPTILLFDIDGTLVTTPGAGRRALERAFVARYGRSGMLNGLRFGGMTDRSIVRAGLVDAPRQRGKHRRKRERRPMVGMLLHIDASSHEWLGKNCWHDLIVVLDDATSQIYYAQLVAQESTATMLAALREVVEQHGVFCALYSDRASHF